MPKRTAPARKSSSAGSSRSAKSKPAAKKPAKKAASKPAKPSKPAAAKKPAAAAAKAASPKPASPKAAAPKPAATKPAASTANTAKVARKGITIVSPKPAKKPTKASTITLPSLGAPLIRPGTVRKPLIESGPNAPSRLSTMGSDSTKPRKSPFDKRQLAKFRAILLRKRAELVGDIATMENEALMGSSGSLSHLPQHMAEQGSDAYGQSLSLDLAAADRRLIKEIDDALARIDQGTYGICELTGKPIKAERLEELPWARYSIEAARELERRANIP